MIAHESNGSDGEPFGPIVDVDWLLAHLGQPGLLVVDARLPGQHAFGHIAGAVALDVHALQLVRSDPESIRLFQGRARQALAVAGIGMNDRVVFYEEISGTLAARGVWLLDYLGVGKGAMLDGGLRAWEAGSGKLTTDIVDPSPSELTLQPRSEALATADEIVAAIEGRRPAVQIIDARNDLEHMLASIPGSISLPWVDALGRGGDLRPLDELRALYDRAGLDRAMATITYCTSGFRSAHTYVVLKALGFAHVRNYAPSWAEWGRSGAFPVSRPDRT